MTLITFDLATLPRRSTTTCQHVVYQHPEIAFSDLRGILTLHVQQPVLDLGGRRTRGGTFKLVVLILVGLELVP